MTKQNLALYLTYMFGTQFGIKSLKRIIQHKEVKIWIDEETGGPSFSYGGYHGRRSEDGHFLMIGVNEIHVRVDKNIVQQLALVEIRSDEDSPEMISLKQQMMVSVYQQIESQIQNKFDNFDTSGIELMAQANARGIEVTRKTIFSLTQEHKHVAH